MDVVLALNVKAVEDSNMSNVLCTQSISEAVFYVLLFLSPFYLFFLCCVELTTCVYYEK